MKRRPSINDVGRAVGVSKSTVSLILQSGDLVRPETAKAARETIGWMGDIYNRAAANLGGSGVG